MIEFKQRYNLGLKKIPNDLESIDGLSEFEFSILQLRKLLEVVALGSLVANKKIYSQSYQSFKKDWNGKRILDNLEKINPYFYPKPVVHKSSEGFAPATHSFDDIKSGYLLRKDYTKVYDYCGKCAHIKNPFDERKDSRGIEFIRDKYTKLWKLVDMHVVTFVDTKDKWLITMNDKRDNEVHVKYLEVIKS